MPHFRPLGAVGQGHGASGKQSFPSTSQNIPHTVTVDMVPLPKLKNLLLHEITFGSEDRKTSRGISKNRFVNLLRNRKKEGYGLEELGIQSCVGFRAKQVRDCEKFVTNVVWDEDEGEDTTHGCSHFWDPEDLSPSEEYDAHYQIFGRHPWDIYDSDGWDDFLPHF